MVSCRVCFQAQCKEHCLKLSTTPLPLEKESCLTRATHPTIAEPSSSSSSSLRSKHLIRQQCDSERCSDHSCLGHRPPHHGEDRQGSGRSDHKLLRPGSGSGGLRDPHVEGDHLHRVQHRVGSDRLGRTVDEVRDAGHGSDAV